MCCSLYKPEYDEFEECDREEDDYYIGRTEWDSPEVDPEVLIAKDKPLAIGEFAQVRITEALPFELMGTSL